MKLNHNHLVMPNFQYPTVPEKFCGPDDLTSLLISARPHPLFGCAPISDTSLQELLSLVYYASLLTEEGRHPRYKIVCEKAEGTDFTIAHFEPIRLDTTDSLRRLAPICHNPEQALLISERNGALWCVGLTDIGGVGVGFKPGHPGLNSASRPRCLSIDIFGPGHLRVREIFASGYEIKGGRIRPLYPYDITPPVRALINSLQSWLFGQIATRISNSEKWKDRVANWLPILLMITKLLRTAIEGKHGGAFVFLPDGNREPTKYGIRPLYQTTLHLGNDLAELWIPCIEASENYGNEKREQLLELSEIRRSRLMVNTGAAGQLSSVDGCVVLTREFKVLGFGAKIEGTVSESSDQSRRYKHIASDTVYRNDEFMKAIGGTRHQSAARVCQLHPGMLAFTVSQDGDVKMFTSDHEFSYAYGPLDLPTVQNETGVG